MRNFKSTCSEVPDQSGDSCGVIGCRGRTIHAFLNRAVAINSIVRVILRILRMDFRRLSSALVGRFQMPLKLVIRGKLFDRGNHLCCRMIGFFHRIFVVFVLVQQVPDILLLSWMNPKTKTPIHRPCSWELYLGNPWFLPK